MTNKLQERLSKIYHQSQNIDNDDVYDYINNEVEKAINTITETVVQSPLNQFVQGYAELCLKHNMVVSMNTDYEATVFDKDYQGQDYITDHLQQLSRNTGVPIITSEQKPTPELRDGEPCGHAGCLSHLSHPCEGCGRIGGKRPRTITTSVPRFLPKEDADIDYSLKRFLTHNTSGVPKSLNTFMGSCGKSLRAIMYEFFTEMIHEDMFEVKEGGGYARNPKEVEVRIFGGVIKAFDIKSGKEIHRLNPITKENSTYLVKDVETEKIYLIKLAEV